MTIKEAQELLEAWVHKHPTQNRSNEELITLLSENISNLLSESRVDNEKLSEIVWITTLLANKSNIDITSALIENLERKNRCKL